MSQAVPNRHVIYQGAGQCPLYISLIKISIVFMQIKRIVVVGAALCFALCPSTPVYFLWKSSSVSMSAPKARTRTSRPTSRGP